MKNHREKMAVQILRDTREHTAREDNKTATSIIIDSRDADRHRGQLQQAFRDYFRFLGKRLPQIDLEKVLLRVSGQVKAETGTQRDGSPVKKDSELDPALMRVLTSWIEEGASDHNEKISALEVVILFGFLVAFQAWCKHYNLPKELSKEAMADAKRWAKRRAQELLKTIQALLRDIIGKFIEKEILENQTPEQIVRALQKYLESDTFTKNLPEDLAASTAIKAFHTGAYHLNALVGCTMKQWFVKDSDACGYCAENAAMGLQDLTFEYIFGVLTPPAHDHCRCNMIYYAVKKQSVEELTSNTV